MQIHEREQLWTLSCVAWDRGEITTRRLKIIVLLLFHEENLKFKNMILRMIDRIHNLGY